MFHNTDDGVLICQDFSPKILFLVVNYGRVFLQQFLGVRSENAFLTFKLDQLLVHQLDMALDKSV